MIMRRVGDFPNTNSGWESLRSQMSVITAEAILIVKNEDKAWLRVFTLEQEDQPKQEYMEPVEDDEDDKTGMEGHTCGECRGFTGEGCSKVDLNLPAGAHLLADSEACDQFQDGVTADQEGQLVCPGCGYEPAVDGDSKEGDPCPNCDDEKPFKLVLSSLFEQDLDGAEVPVQDEVEIGTIIGPDVNVKSDEKKDKPSRERRSGPGGNTDASRY